MKKQRNLLIGAAILLAVVLVGYFGLDYIQQKELKDVYSEDVGIVLNDLKKEDICSISYQGKENSGKGNSLSFQLKDGTWYAENDPAFPLSQEKLDLMVYYLAGLTADKQLSETATNLQSFGLDPAQITIKATCVDGTVLTYFLGNQLPDGSGYYLLAEGDPALYQVPALFHDAFSQSLPQLGAQSQLPTNVDSAKVSYFSVSRPEDQLMFVQSAEGSDQIYTDQYHWQISCNGESYQAASATSVTNMLKAILKLQYLEVVSYDANEQDLKKYGLDNPIKIDMDYLPTASKENEEAAQPEENKIASMHLQLGATDQNGNVYARLEGSQLVGVVDGTILQTLAYDGPQNFLPKDVCLIGLDTVVGMDITANGEHHTIVVNRSSNQQEATTYSLDNRTIENERFTAFYDLLTTMEADDTTQSGSQVTKSATFTIHFHRNTSTFQEMTLEFIPYDNNFYLVDFDGRRDLLANKRDVEDLLSAFKAL